MIWQTTGGKTKRVPSTQRQSSQSLANPVSRRWPLRHMRQDRPSSAGPQPLFHTEPSTRLTEVRGEESDFSCFMMPSPSRSGRCTHICSAWKRFDGGERARQRSKIMRRKEGDRAASKRAGHKQEEQKTCRRAVSGVHARHRRLLQHLSRSCP
jgi:hypothetical protein